MRVRIVVASALVLVAGALLLDMSGRASRTAGSDHVYPAVFSASVPGGGRLCQPVAPVPSDAAKVEVLIGTYGRAVPELDVSFLDAAGSEVAAGRLPAGGREGYVAIPLALTRGAPAVAMACLRVGGSSTVVLGGEAGAASGDSEVVNGHEQGGRISLLYVRASDESWWQLLPTLTTRFGVGKASFFGRWTLPALALMLLGVWVFTIRLLSREFG